MVTQIIQVNTAPICIGAKGDKYGVFQSPINAAVKFFHMTHISGGVAWDDCEDCQGKWGDGETQFIELHITNTKNERVAPSPDFKVDDEKHLRYKIPGQDYNDSKLTFPKFSPKLIVHKNQTFRVWYGEDLANYEESDNSGTTCANVSMEYEEL